MQARIPLIREPAQPGGLRECCSSSQETTSSFARFRKKAKSAHTDFDHLNAATPVDGTFIAQVELPSHFDAVSFETLINDCWAKVDWGYDRVLVRNGTDRGWIDYMLKTYQKVRVRRLT